MQTLQPLIDILGHTIELNDTAVRAIGYSQGDIQLCRVTKIQDGKCYLDNSKTAIRFPKRLCVITPLVSQF